MNMSQTNKYLGQLLRHGKALTIQMIEGDVLVLTVSESERDDNKELIYRPEHLMISRAGIEDSLEEMASYEDMRYVEGFQA
jgi:hypothetical protein